MRISDPFPIGDYQGLQPTHALDWPAMARKVVRDVLQVRPDERVVLLANPYCGAAMLEEVRAEIQRAGAIELATIMHWTPALTGLRGPDGGKSDPRAAAAEEEAMAALFAIADVFIWLMNDWRVPAPTHAVGQSERLLENWKGRGVHFHWFHDPADPDPDRAENMALDLVYQRAVLDVDNDHVKRVMAALADRLGNATVRVTDPAGTDISFRLAGHFHQNHGDASRRRVAQARTARDREEEIPCGGFRAIPEADSVNGVISFDGDQGYPVAGNGIDFGEFLVKGLRIHFTGGRITCLETGGDQARLDELWGAEQGDKDRLGEIVIGCNPLLQPVPGMAFPPYHGYGEAVLRLTIGENRESGGVYRSTLHRWLMFPGSTITAGGKPVVEDGRFTKLITG